MRFGQFLMILRSRFWTIFATCVVITIAVAAITLALPKQYTATVSVVVDAKPLDPIAGSTLPGAGSIAMQNLLATQEDILKNQRVALTVVKNLQLDQYPALRQKFMDDTGEVGDIRIWLADALRKNLEIQPTRDSTVFNISYTGPDRNLVSTIANAFAQAYIATNLEMKVEPAKQYAAWFDERSKSAREDLERAQRELSEHQRKTGILATDERTDIESARLAELSSQLVGLQAQSADTRSRQRQASQQSIETLPEVLTHPLVQNLKADIARAEGKLEDFNAQLGKNHPQVERAEAELAVLRRKLDSEMQRVVSAIGSSSLVNQSRERELRARLDAQRAKVMAMKTEREQMSLLQAEAANAQKAYDAVTTRYQQTSLESLAKQTNFYLLNPAVEPNRHSRPNLFLNTAVGAVLGTMLGIALAILREYRDRRVRSMHDLPVLPGLPLLGRISRSKHGQLINQPLIGAPSRLRLSDRSPRNGDSPI